MLLVGKLALVTGAAQGIGQAVAEGFSKEGATVVLVDINQKVHQTTEALNVQFPQTPAHSAFICDVSNSEQVNDMFEQIKLAYDGRTPTLIVSNAGIGSDNSLIETTDADFESVINVNLKGGFLVSRAAMRHLVPNFQNVKLGKTETYASVIFMSSVAGRRGYSGNSVYYSASKAGIEAIVRQSAHELGKYKIRFNAVCPGPIDTPMQTDPERMAMHVGFTKLGRVGEPHEVADLCVFLASDKSSYITGTSIEVSGGYFI